MRKILTLLLAISVVALASISPPAVAALSADSAKLLAISPDDRVLGDPKAPITIVEYASLSCPHCAHFTTEVLPELKKKWIDTGKVKLVLRDFPLDEPALRAAMIARCAPPDRFYAFVDTFFGAQDKWVTGDFKQGLSRLAKLGGMSNEEFDACLNNKALENKILESRLVAAKDLEVNATPTFFINGAKFTGAPTVEEFDRQLSTLAPKS
jgi:protein-disulfide isomerase